MSIKNITQIIEIKLLTLCSGARQAPERNAAFQKFTIRANILATNNIKTEENAEEKGKEQRQVAD